MLRVTVKTDKHLTTPLDAQIEPNIRISRSVPVANNQLKVFHCDEASQMFDGLSLDDQVSFSINRAEFETYYYQGKDDAGFIFQSNP